MKVLLPLLIIQLFGIVINLPAKELPLYGEVEINGGEYIFLKSDLFKIGKKIELIIYFSFFKNFIIIIQIFMLIIVFPTKMRTILV